MKKVIPQPLHNTLKDALNAIDNPKLTLMYTLDLEHLPSDVHLIGA